MKAILTAILLCLAATTALAKTERAIVAGGCFWCVEANFESVKGVRKVVSGFTGGTGANPTYDDHTGHYEAVEITFDNAVVTYGQIIHLFLRSSDVTDPSGQFCDRGPDYRSAIFALNADQKATAKAEIADAAASLGRKVVTPVKTAGKFWPAEAYHQDFAKGTEIILTRAGPKQKKNAYKFYRKACGRDARVKELWGKEAAFTH